MNRSRRRIIVGAVAAALSAATLLAPGRPASSSPAPPDFQATVKAILFAGAPDYSSVRRDADQRLAAEHRPAFADLHVSEDEYLAHARAAADCVREALAAEVSEPRMENGRAVWNIRFGPMVADSSPTPREPSAEVARASRECHDRHLTQLERLWLSQSLPQGEAWHRMRTSLFQCLGVPDDFARVAEALFAEISRASGKGCLMKYELLFGTIR